jgi:hypothetical protein
VVTVNAVLLAALRAVAGPDEDTLFDRLPNDSVGAHLRRIILLPTLLVMAILPAINATLSFRLAIPTTRLTAMTSSRTTMKLFDRLYLATPGADLLDGVRIDLDREPLIVAVDES